MQDRNEAHLEALQEIRSIMDRSVKFVSLSGMSGIWAGCTALIGAFIANTWLQKPLFQGMGAQATETTGYFDPLYIRFMLLGISVFFVALSGAFFFTFRKAKRLNHTLWSTASRQLMFYTFFPMFAGGVFCITFIYRGCGQFVGPACLVFYGLALISASKHTLSDIRYLGMLQVALGCCNLFFPDFGLYFWAAGFGVLHVIYGAVLWNKYDK